MKNECKEKAPLKFVGLRSKMYCMLVDKDCMKKTVEGIKNSYRTNVCVRKYRDVLRARNMTHAAFRNIRSVLHTLETVQWYKNCLLPYDDKRYVLDNDVNALAYGHCSLRNE